MINKTADTDHQSIHISAKSRMGRELSPVSTQKDLHKCNKSTNAHNLRKIPPISASNTRSPAKALGPRIKLWHRTDASGDEVAKTSVETQAYRQRWDNANMTMKSASSLTRRGLLRAFAATAVVAAPNYANAAGFLRGGGDIRRVKMYSGRTGESIDTIYWIEGNYIPEAITEINRFFRDWRNGQTHQIDTRTVDIIAATQNLLDSDQPYTLISGYRSPQTNAMLRANSSGVARNSLHLQGKASDLRMQGRSVSQVARAAASCSAGGVGRYSGSNFVHVDCGPVRSWGS